MALEVVDEWKTVDKLIEGYSIARYGDGEFEAAFDGASLRSQTADKTLSKRLRGILSSNVERLLVAIPNVFDQEMRVLHRDERKMEFWRNIRKRFESRLPQRTYYSSFVSRIEPAHKHLFSKEFWSHWCRVWEGRRAVVIGNAKGCANADFTSRFLTNAESVAFVSAPKKNAFAEYERLVAAVRAFSRNHLILCMLGPTATVLAHDLTEAGYQTIDSGHLFTFCHKFAIETY